MCTPYAVSARLDFCYKDNIKEHFCCVLSAAAQHGQKKRVCPGGIHGRAPQFPTDVQVWRGNAHIWHKVCEGISDKHTSLYEWHALWVGVPFLAQRRGSLHGPIASCGVCAGRAPPCRPTVPLCSGVLPRGWAELQECPSSSTAVTWVLLLVTTSLYPLSSHCMWV